MSWCISVDPGVSKGHGIALFEDDVLRAAFVGSVEDLTEWHRNTDTHGTCRFVIERPTTIGGRSLKGDTNDLLDLSIEVGRMFQWAMDRDMLCYLARPVEWKGSTPKEITFRRTWESLSMMERAFLQIPDAAKRKLHAGKDIGRSYAGDVLDAVGIGLWRLGRMNTRARA